MDAPEDRESSIQADHTRFQAAKKDEEDAATGQKPSIWQRRKRLIIGSIMATLLALSLSLGLGLGLGIPRSCAAGNTTAPTIWQPAAGTSWQIILSYALDINADSPSVEPDVDVFDIDLFLHQDSTVIDSLHGLGKKVVCYFSAGSYEPGRPDSSQFPDSDLGSELDGWPGEFWLNTNSEAIRKIMVNRIELASKIGCDAVDPDNVDGYQNTNGLDLTPEDAISYVKFLAAEAKKRGLAVGLKNAGDIIPDVISEMQFSVNEECSAYDECDTFAAFIEAGKPVFHIEYPDNAPDNVSDEDLSKACTSTGTTNFSTVVKTLDLDGWVEYCDGTTAETAVVGEE